MNASQEEPGNAIDTIGPGPRRAGSGESDQGDFSDAPAVAVQPVAVQPVTVQSVVVQSYALPEAEQPQPACSKRGARELLSPAVVEQHGTGAGIRVELRDGRLTGNRPALLGGRWARRALSRHS